MAREQQAAVRSRESGFPRDRFDELTKQRRVGAHRIVAEPRRFSAYLVSALLGIVLLTGAGIITLMVTGANVSNLVERWGEEQEPGSGGSETPSVQAQLDPAAEVVVLNGTGSPGFAAVVDGIITENEWGTILFSGEAATRDVEISAVFYGAEDDEAAALGLARELGGVSTFRSDAYSEYGARLIVLLGTDYAGPGSEASAGVEDSA